MLEMAILDALLGDSSGMVAVPKEADVGVSHAGSWMRGMSSPGNAGVGVGSAGLIGSERYCVQLALVWCR